MINQQLLEYVRQQLASGVSKEDAAKALIANGWQVADINEAFSSLEKNLSSPALHVQTPSIPASAILQPKIVTTMTKSVFWSKYIPRYNFGFMIASLVLVGGLDLLIVISNPPLFSFWAIMLGVLAVFIVFYCLENFVFRKRFADTTSALDPWISAIVFGRNIIFILNFIPGIQLIGLAAIAGFLTLIPTALFGGGEIGSLGGFGVVGMIAPALFVLYVILIIARFSTTKR